MDSLEACLSSSICFSWHRKHYPQVKKFRLANEASSGTMENLLLICPVNLYSNVGFGLE